MYDIAINFSFKMSFGICLKGSLDDIVLTIGHCKTVEIRFFTQVKHRISTHRSTNKFVWPW